MIDENFDKIIQWLQQHAPKIASQSLQPGGSETELQDLEALAGKPLPEDLKAFYRLCNGLSDDGNVGSLFYGMDVYSVKEMMDVFEFCQSRSPYDKLKKCHPYIKSGDLLNPYWLYLGFDGSHCSLRIDLDPAEGGTYGQVIFIDDEFQVGIWLADSLTMFMESFMTDLENGLYTKPLSR
jgi:cell wall assembly regulator SMI1